MEDIRTGSCCSLTHIGPASQYLDKSNNGWIRELLDFGDTARKVQTLHQGFQPVCQECNCFFPGNDRVYSASTMEGSDEKEITPYPFSPSSSGDSAYSPSSSCDKDSAYSPSSSFYTDSSCLDVLCIQTNLRQMCIFSMWCAGLYYVSKHYIQHIQIQTHQRQMCIFFVWWEGLYHE